jgi:hypothetical protein
MLADGRVTLAQSLALADAWRDWYAGTALDTPPPDPLRLDLPPVLQGQAPTPQTIGVVGNLYLMAELEQAGLVPAVEALVEARSTLPIHGRQGAAKLDAYHVQSVNWYDRDHRNRLFARIFGIGAAATNEAGGTVNREFEQRLAALCLAIQQYARDYQFGQQASAAHEVSVRQAAADLVGSIATRVSDSTLYASQHLQEQLQRALQILADPEIGAVFGARGVWATLRAILGGQTPDLGRLVSRGQYGQRLLQWLATVLDQVEITPDKVASQPILGPTSPAFQYASGWLEASAIGAGVA